MASGLGLQVLSEAAADLVEDQADERLGAIDVGWRHDEIECGRALAAHYVGDAPVATPCDLGDDGISVEAQERHGGAEYAGALIVRLVEQLACGAGDDRVRSSLAEMAGLHHRGERRLDRPLRIRCV